jgi:hypothetical protein
VSGIYQLYFDYSNLYPSGYEIPVIKSVNVWYVGRYAK